MITATIAPPSSGEVALIVLAVGLLIERELLRVAASPRTNQLVAVLSAFLPALLVPVAAILALRLAGML